MAKSLDEYEKIVMLKDGSKALIRPVRGEDAEDLLKMFTTLSPETVYNRFFKLRRPFTIEEVQKMTSINFDEEFALVASPLEASELKIIGDARYYVEDKIRAEVAIVVQDRWQFKGLGTAMLQHLINIGRENNIREFYIYVLSDNAVMIHVAKKLGFRLKSQSYGISRFDLTFQS
ncbi:MAG: GNAT family N-acetyltransferase [Nitrososphaeria archaeon]|nr:GNAT family N-acetyltransferase [Nitrososphaeria archaeon]